MDLTNLNRNKQSRRRSPVDLSTIIYGKVPPQARDLERAILGAMLLDQNAYAEVRSYIKPDEFYVDAHIRICQAIFEIGDEGISVDILLVIEKLKEKEELEIVGGPYYITQLTNDVVSSANIIQHCNIVKQYAVARGLITMCGEVITRAYEDGTDPFDILSFAEEKLFEINNRIQEVQSTSKDYVAVSIAKNLADRRESDRNPELKKAFLKPKNKGWAEYVGHFRNRVYVVAGRPAMGKCLGKGTKVIMFTGKHKNVEDIIEGDVLMGPDSKPRVVTTIARGKENMYWVRQNKAMDYRVNESHILSLKRSRNALFTQRGDVLNISVGEYIKKSNKFKTNYKGYKTGVEFKDVATGTISPYMLGLWLGDGNSRKYSITNQDPEIIKYLNNWARVKDYNLSEDSQPDRCTSYNLSKNKRKGTPNHLVNSLRKDNLILNKHIPDRYLYNSRKKRLQLLAGLIDSDGHYADQFHCYEIVQKNERLARDIKYLCDSLGFKVSIKRKRASIKALGFEGIVWRVRIFGHLNEIPVKVKYKKARQRNSPQDHQVTGIKVEFDCYDDYYGFTIDGPDGLFLLEDFTVTHNTDFIVSEICDLAQEIPVGFISIEMDEEELGQRIICNRAELSNDIWDKHDSLFTQDDEERFMFGLNEYYNLKLEVDTKNKEIGKIINKIRFWKNKLGVQIVFIDYLQIVTIMEELSKYMTEVQVLNYILEKLGSAAKSIGIPIVLLSQLNRELYKHGSKEPNLSHLKGSGKIEEIAYQIMFLHRPEYYDISVDDLGESTKGLLYLIYAKNRGGKTGRSKCKYRPQYSRVEEWEGLLPPDFNPMHSQFSADDEALPF